MVARTPWLHSAPTLQGWKATPSVQGLLPSFRWALMAGHGPAMMGRGSSAAGRSGDNGHAFRTDVWRKRRLVQYHLDGPQLCRSGGVDVGGWHTVAMPDELTIRGHDDDPESSVSVKPPFAVQQTTVAVPRAL